MTNEKKSEIETLAVLLGVPVADVAAAHALIAERVRTIPSAQLLTPPVPAARHTVADEILDASFGQSMISWRADLAAGIAKAHGVRIYQHKYAQKLGGGRTEPRVRLHAIGYPEDIARVRELYSSAWRQVERLYLAEHDRVGEKARGKTWAANFKGAAALRIGTRVVDAAGGVRPLPAGVESASRKIRPILRAAPADAPDAREAGTRAGGLVSLAPVTAQAAQAEPVRTSSRPPRVRLRSMVGAG